jgi:hypothetical protein
MDFQPIRNHRCNSATLQFAVNASDPSRKPEARSEAKLISIFYRSRAAFVTKP